MIIQIFDSFSKDGNINILSFAQSKEISMSEEIGKFSLKFAGNTYTSESNGDVTIRQNWEGSGDGFGAVFGTLTFGPTPPSDLNSGGTIKWVGQAFLEDGTTVIGQGEGTWETPRIGTLQRQLF